MDFEQKFAGGFDGGTDGGANAGQMGKKLKIVFIITGASGCSFAFDFAEAIAPFCELFVAPSAGCARTLAAEAASGRPPKTGALGGVAGVVASVAPASDAPVDFADTASLSGRPAKSSALGGVSAAGDIFAERVKKLYAAGARAVFAPDDLAAPIASGSFEIDAYFAYASANFCAAAAAGLAADLPQRAAAVALKERRRFVLAAREMPLGRAMLKALAELDAAGVFIAPPVIADYGGCSDRAFLAGRYAQLLGLDWRGEFRPWGADFAGTHRPKLP